MTIKPFAVACVSLVLLLACGKVRFPDYYSLALAPTPPPQSNDRHFLGVLQVRDFETAPYLREGRIVYRKSPTEVGFYEYHRWVIDPSATVTSATVSALRSSGQFTQVDSGTSHVKPDFLLRGQLGRLDEIDYGGPVRVEVKLSAQLINLGTASIVWSGEESETAQIEKATVNSVVIGMSGAVQKCIDRLLADMLRQVGNRIQRSSNSELPNHKPRF